MLAARHERVLDHERVITGFVQKQEGAARCHEASRVEHKHPSLERCTVRHRILQSYVGLAGHAYTIAGSSSASLAGSVVGVP